MKQFLRESVKCIGFVLSYSGSYVSKALLTTIVVLSVFSNAFAKEKPLQSPKGIKQEISKELKEKVRKTLKENAKTLRFMENKGQFPSDKVLYYFEGENGAAYIERNLIRFLANDIDKGSNQVKAAHSFSLKFDGANPLATIELGESFLTHYNFFMGENSKGVSGVKAAKDLTINNLYPGIDLRLYSSKDGALEFDWIVNPGADFKSVKMNFEGQDNLGIERDGKLKVGLRFTDVQFNIPESYQVTEQGKQKVNFNFHQERGHIISFNTQDKIDPTLPLIIDPILNWGTYFDGNNSAFDQYLYAIQVDSSTGYLYCAGSTNRQIATNAAPYTANGYLNTISGLNGGQMVAVIYSVSSSGNQIIDLTLFGPASVVSGNKVEAFALSLSPNKVFVGGYTNLAVPMAGSSFDNSLGGTADGYVAVFSKDLGTLSYSTYLGGTGNENRGVTSIRSIDDNTFVVGMTAAAALPTSSPNYISSGVVQSTFSGTSDFYIAKFSSLNTLTWGTYVGTSSDATFNDLEVLNDNTIAFCGYATGTLTASEVNSITTGSTGTDEDGVIGVLNSTATSYNFLDKVGASSGTNKNDRINDVEIVGDTLYFTGSGGNNFPVSGSGVYHSAYYGGASDVIVGKCYRGGGSGSYKATFYGTSGDDLGNGIRLVSSISCSTDPVTYLMVFGTVNGASLPTVNINNESFYNSSRPGGIDIFYSGFNSQLNTLAYGTYIGGSGNDYLGATGDPRGANHLWVNGVNVYVGTTTHSDTTNFRPLTFVNGFDLSRSSSGNDAHIIFSIQFASLLQSDYGDAPSSYGTPSHVISCNTLKIGALDDNETASQPSTYANGDDLNNLDDEDGITTIPTIYSSTTSYSLTVDNILNVSGSTATLYGWVDFNGDGAFQTNEFASTTVATGSNGVSKTLTWSGITVSGSASSRYIRIRLTTNSLADDAGTSSVDERSTVSASNGEIEDYIAVGLNCPTAQTENPCQTQGAINTKFTTWLATASAGGCVSGGTLSNNSGSAPSVLTGGTATVTFTYTNSCSTASCSSTFTVTAPSTITLTNSKTDVLCNGNSTGAIDLSVSGGTAPYTYLWSNGATTQDITGLAAGSYSVTVTDANGCTGTTNITITQPAALSVSISSQTNVACYGGSTGALTMSGTGGTSPYQYKYDGGAYQSSATFTGLVAATNLVTIKDANNCTATVNTIITQPSAALSASISSQTNVLCFGSSTGSVTVAGANGTSPYQYKLDAGAYQVSGTFSSLAAGSYTVTVKDANNCTTTQAVTITQTGTALIAGISSQTNVLCYGNSTGAVTVAGSGATSPYQYKLDAGAYQVSGTFSSLAAGSYTVTVKDANNCTTTQAVTITQPSATLSASISSQTNVLCYGNSTGAVTVAGAGGTTAYQYKLDAGAYQVSGTFSSLAAGSYTVTVKDANNCTTTQAVTITQPSATLSASITSQTNVLCYGNSTGAVTVAGAGGTTSYQYKIDAGVYQVSGTFSSLAAGSYTVTVKDANNCTTTQAVTITQPSATLSASITSQTNVLCYGNSTGAVTVVGAGGTTTYQYKLDAGSYQASGTFSSLAAGSYTVTVKDANNCTTTQAVTITQPSTPLGSSITSQTNVLCYGNSTGAVTVLASGGTTSYQYKLDAGAYQVSGAFSSLAAGSYTVTVKDANNCTTTQAVTITQPSATLSASISSQTNVLCYGNSTGAVTVLGAGGSGIYTYKIGSGSYQSSGTFGSLAAGAYTITVQDANGCTTTQAVTITQPSAALSASISSQTNVLCYGNSTGAVTVAGTGGTGTLQYKIGSGAYQASGTFSSLAAGAYTVTVQDANGCTTTQAVTISGPLSGLTASISSQTNVLCYGNTTGAVTVAGTGGTTAYQYKLDAGAYQVSGAFSSLAAGSYTVTVKDANNCTTTQAVTITQPSATLSASINSQTNVLCYGNSTGAVTVAGAGGTTSYQYKLDAGAYQASGTFSSLAAGSYTVTIKDANNCTTTQAVVITQPSAVLSASISSQTNVLCYGNLTGAVTVAGAGGTTAYQYKIENGAYQSSGTFSSLAAGAYTVTIKDANNCTTTQAVTITGPSSGLSASISSQTNVLCYGNSTGAVTVAGTGGTTAYQYKIDAGAYQSSGTFSGLAAGSYTVTVKDANNCTSTQAVTITQPSAALSASISTQTNVSCYGNLTGAVTLVAAGGTSAYQYKLDAGAYQVSGTFSSLAAGSYTITIKDANNCTTTQAVVITSPSAALSASISAQTDVLCYGNATGSVSVVGANGTSPYQYKIGSGAYQSSGTFSSLTAGAYTVTVQDANGCTTTQAVTISQPIAALSASISSQTNVLCYGNSTGSVTVVGANGTSPYQYKIGSGSYQVSGTFSSLSAGSYTVTIKDVNNCVTTQAVNITQPTLPLASSITAQTNIICYSGTGGSVTVAGVDGTSPYQYKLDAGSYQASGTFTSLVSGSYTVTVKDANNCTTTQAVTITGPSSAVNNSIASQTNVICYGAATGIVTVVGSGGTGPIYAYKIGNGIFQASGTFGGLTAGNYTITIEDENNCTTTQAVTITQPASAVSASISSQTNVTCYGLTNGSVTVVGSGGTAPYQYKFNNGSYQSSGTYSSLAPGTYTITVKDANDCITNKIVTITQPAAAISASCSSVNSSAYGVADGSASVTPSGGTAPYTYLWSNGATTSTATGLVSGTYTVTITDANGCLASCITSMNNFPQANFDSITVAEDATINTNVSNNDVLSADGGNTYNITCALCSSTAHGTLTFNSNGTFTYVPDPNYNGPDQFIYTLCDGGGDCDTALVTINVTPVDDTPGATWDGFNTNEDTPYSGSVASNDAPSGDGGNVWSLVTPPAHGSVTVNPNGTILYTPTANYNGPDQFIYQLCDVDGDCDTALVVLTVTPVDDYPIAVWDAASTNEDTPLNSSLTANDSQSGDGGNVWSLVTTAAHGSVTVNPNGTYTYTPNSNYNGTDQFVYQLCDVDGDCDTAIVYLTINSVNDAPVAIWDSKTTGVNVAVNGSVGGNDTDVDNNLNPTGFTLTTGPAHGSITFNSDGTYTYTPTSNYNGNDEFVYQVCDLGMPILCDTAVVYLTVSNNPPVANVDFNSTSNDAPISSTVAGNDTDPDGNLDANSYTLSCATCSNVSNGVLIFNSNGSYTYTPNSGFTGTDHFVYQVCDNGSPALCDTAVVYITQIGSSITAQTNENCYNDAIGSVTVAGTGGTAPYQYKIGSGAYQSSGTFSGLSAGTYTVTVKDANNYTTTQSVTITQPSVLSNSISSQTNVGCYGSTTGSVTVAGSGGTAPYQYKIGSGAYQVSGTFSGLAAGSYSVTTKDANNCTATQSVTITQPASSVGISLVSQTNLICFGGAGGSVVVAGNGGTAPYQYKLDAGSYQVSGTFTGLVGGTYTLTVKDANNCTSTLPVIISGPSSALTASITYQKNVGCNGGANGVVTVVGSGGSGGIYTYKLDAGAYQASGTFGGLAAGSYTITIQDANGCTTTQAVTITQPTVLVANIIAQTNVLCYGGLTGSITASGSGGNPLYEYRIAYGAYQSSGIFTGLSAGTYVITVKDANDCIEKVNVTITQPSSPLSAVLSAQTNITCYGNNNGSLTIAATNGTAPYTYSIDGSTFQVSNTFNSLNAGSYTITVKDANNCTTTLPAIITQPSGALSSNLIAQTNLTCFGATNGAISVTGVNGTAPYQYKLDAGAYQSSGIFSGLAAGSYTITIKDANNCTTTQAVTITGPSSALSSTITYQKNVSCYGNATGVVTVLGSGGNGPIFTYKIDGGNYQGSGTFSGLSAGAHTVTIQDANGCTATQSVTITQPASTLLALIVSQTNVLCYGGATGSVTATGSGGTAPYVYQINYGGYQASGTFNNLTAGSYMITVKDANDCIEKVQVIITQPAAPLNASITSQTNVLCFGGSTGAVTIGATGGTSPYQYKLDAGAYQVSSTFSGLSSGSYTITIKDANNCTATQAVTITQPALAFAATCNLTNPTYSGATNGSISLTLANGSAPYVYLWSNASTASSLSGLSTGTYSVTVTDHNGCTATCSSTLNNYPVATYDSYNTTVNVGISGSVTGNDNDIDGNINANSYSVITSVAHGILILSANGGYSYSPDLNYSGTDYFIYQVCDLGSPSLCDTAVVYINVIGSPVTPAVSISTSSTTICAGTSLTFNATPTYGGASPSYQWQINGSNVGANSSSFTNASWTNGDVVTCIMTSNDPSAFPTTATSNSIALTVSASPAQPAAFTSSSSNLYWGQTSVTYTVPSVFGVTYSWSYTGTGLTINGSGNSVTVDVAQGATSGTLSVIADNGSCISPARSIAITVHPYLTWTCGSITNWNDASNWDGGFVPYSTINVLIPASAPCQPHLPSSFCVNNLTVNSGASITIPFGSTLCVNGSFTNNGSICKGNLILSGSSAQTIAGNGSVCNFELNNASGATITSGDTLKITETYIPTDGVLTTNGGLELLSDENGTATVLEHPGACTPYISGNVIVLQYIPGGRRAFRFLSHPFSIPIGLDQLTDDIDITGTGGAANGFTPTATNNPSAFWYNTITGNGSAVDDVTGWIPFTNTNGAGANAWNPMEGLRVLIRGTKGQGLTTCVPCVPDPVTIDMMGPINQCQKIETLLTNANCGYNFIGNPYPSNIDLSLTTRGSAVGANFSVWDPHQGTHGAYVDQPFAFSYILPAYSAFFTTSSSNTNNTVEFDESNKTSADPTGNLFKTTSAFGNNVLQLRILSNNDSLSWDRFLMFFNPTAAVDSDKLDKQKQLNPNLDFYTVTPDKHQFSIDVRPFAYGQVVPLGLRADSLTNYAIRVDDYDVPNGAQIYLHDKFNNSVQPLSLGLSYPFDVNANPLTQGDRFELYLSYANGINDVNNHPSVTIVPNPAVDEVTIWTNASIADNSPIVVRNTIGETVYSGVINKKANDKITLSVKDWASGIYFITIQSNNNIISEKLMKK